MFQKNSFSAPSDTSGVFLVKIIQTRRCSFRKHAKTGKFLRIVLKQTKPHSLRRRKKRMRGLTLRTSHKFFRPDGMTFKFDYNALVILRRRMNTLGREVIGPTSKEMKIKKFRKSVMYIF